MRNLQCYEIGAMKGLSFAEYMKWRVDATNILKEYAEDTGVTLRVVNPAERFNYEIMHHKSTREIKDWELREVGRSDFCLLNLDKVEGSVGSHFEIAVAGILSIPIVAFGSTEGISSFILDSCIRIEDTLEEACTYMRDYYLL